MTIIGVTHFTLCHVGDLEYGKIITLENRFEICLQTIVG